MAQKKQLLTYPEEVYVPQAIQNGLLTERQVRKEYSRLLAIGMKRYARMVEAGYAERESAKMLKAQLVRLKDIPQSARSLSYHLTGLARVLGLKTSTVSGIKAAETATLERLHKYGYNFVTEKNIGEFGAYMESKRALVQENVIESDVIARVWNQAARLKVPIEDVEKDFSFFVKNLDEIEEIPVSQGGGSSKAVRKYLGRKE